MRLRQLDLRRFKGFERFTLTFGDRVYLVGPNNAGKSTLVAATRAAAAMLSVAQRRRPSTFRRHGIKRPSCHLVPAGEFGLVTENLRHQFRNEETSIRVRTDTDLILSAVWPSEEEYADDDAFFYLEHEDGRFYKDPKSVREHSGLVGVIPALTPLAHSERLLDEAYVRQESQGRRVSQHARNHLWAIQRDGDLNDFVAFAREWLPEIAGLEVSLSPTSPGEASLDVFVTEASDPTPKELFWAGDGIQVFVQLLTHLWRLRFADVVVLDEPDLYLHADLQRRLVRLLNSTSAQTITATHSPEMLAEAPGDSVVWVDRSRRRAVRRPSAASLGDLSAQIGSAFNLRLATALRAGVVLFVEGKDMAVLRTLAKRVGATRVAEERGCAVIELNGFSNWSHVEPFQWLVNEFLSGSVDVYVLLDRDYRDDVEVTGVVRALSAVGVTAHVWNRKELESYLLSPSAIARRSGASEDAVRGEMDRITEQMTSEVVGRLAAERHDARRSTGVDLASTIGAAVAELTPLTSDPDWRLTKFPAKEILAALNRWLQSAGHESVSAMAVARELRADEIPDEMVEQLRLIESSIRK